MFKQAEQGSESTVKKIPIDTVAIQTALKNINAVICNIVSARRGVRWIECDADLSTYAPIQY